MKIFKIETKLDEYKKYKIVTILGCRLKFKIKNSKALRAFFKKNKPCQFIKPTTTRKEVYVSIAAIYKNEPDIIEWIEYHKIIGIERFYLYDNESTDNSKELLKKYIDDGVVIYHYLPGKVMQLTAYKDAVFNYKNETKWLAMIDLDEYIVPVKKDNLKDLLKDYENYPALGINWNSFDSNNHIERPKTTVIEAYTRTTKNKNQKLEKHIKSIVNPRKVLAITNPHFCFYRKKELAVTENFEQIGNFDINGTDNAFTKYNSINKIKINHYHTKSQEDYNNKIKTGYSDRIAIRPEKDSRMIFEDYIYDYTAQKYLPELKEILASKRERENGVT